MSARGGFFKLFSAIPGATMPFLRRLSHVLRNVNRHIPSRHRSAPNDPQSPLSPSEQSDLVPAYFRPPKAEAVPEVWAQSDWGKMLRVIRLNSIVVINPASGPFIPPVDVVAGLIDDYYREAITRSHRRGVKVLGYVPTGRGKVPLVKAIRDVDEYRTLFRNLDGFFLDEMNNNAEEPAVRAIVVHGLLPTIPVSSYCGELRDHIRAGAPDQTIVGNPGDVTEAQTGWAIVESDPVVDVLVVKEDEARAYISWLQPSWAYPGTSQMDAYRIAHLVHHVQDSRLSRPSQEHRISALSRERHAGFVYITDDTGHPPTLEGKLVLWRKIPNSWTNRAPRPDPVLPRNA